MAEVPAGKDSRFPIVGILITAAVIAMVVAIVLPVYLGTIYKEQQIEELAARAQPVLDALIEAEKAYKEQHGKFWRDSRETLSPEATKQALGVDLGAAPDYRFAIYPPDLVADPTLRVAARGTGDAEGITVECVYDAVGRTKNCKRL